MRFQGVQAAIRTLTTAVRSVIPARRLRAATTALFPSFGRHPLPLSGATVLKSAPAIPFLSSFFGSTAHAETSGESNRERENNMSYPGKRSEEEWRAILTPEQFRVLREKGTEPAFTGEYDNHFPSKGVYTCAGCNAPLYRAAHKFKSGCGWPAYYDCIPGAVNRHLDTSFGMERTEIVCANCGGHLGHVFKGEGDPTPTDERHCVNSISLRFTEDESMVAGEAEKKAKA